MNTHALCPKDQVNDGDDSVHRLGKGVGEWEEGWWVNANIYNLYIHYDD